MHEMEILHIYGILKKLAIYDDTFAHHIFLFKVQCLFTRARGTHIVIWQVIIDVDVLFYLKTFLVHRALINLPQISENYNNESNNNM